jgi:glycosyltransferase involved in cell wall biosynthesis
MLKITYVVTVYNEVETVEKAIKDVISINYPNKEIIVIDNCSKDGSVEIIKKLKKKILKIILRKKNIGFGNSIITGIKRATGDYIFIQYADLEYDHKRSIYMMNYANKKKLDVVLGSRYKNNKKSVLELLIERPSYLATLITTYLINAFYGHNFTDVIGGKLYKRKSIEKIRPNSRYQGFDFEFMSIICKKKLKIGEVYIKYKPRKNFSEKKIKFYHMINALYQILKIKFFKYY